MLLLPAVASSSAGVVATAALLSTIAGTADLLVPDVGEGGGRTLLVPLSSAAPASALLAFGGSPWWGPAPEGAFPSFAAVPVSPSLLSLLPTDNDAPGGAAAPNRAVVVVGVLDIIQVYGRLAGRSCFGIDAPPGASCQVSLPELTDKLLGGGGIDADDTVGLLQQPSSLTFEQFGRRLEQLNFAWPLKPYGVGGSSTSNAKTALANKGVETRLYLHLLEEYHLGYDAHNPAAGPLPSNLRPRLNDVVQRQPLNPVVVQRTWDLLSSSSRDDTLRLNLPPNPDVRSTRGVVTADSLTNALRDGPWDYYDFLQRYVPESSISWR